MPVSAEFTIRHTIACPPGDIGAGSYRLLCAYPCIYKRPPSNAFNKGINNKALRDRDRVVDHASLALARFGALVLVPALATRYADRASLSLVNRRSRIQRFNDCPPKERRWHENLESCVEYLPASLPSYLSGPPPLTAAGSCPFGVTTVQRGGSIGSVQVRRKWHRFSPALTLRQQTMLVATPLHFGAGL